MRLGSGGTQEAGPGVLRVIDEVADETHSAGVRPVTGRIGGHRFEGFVAPPGPAPADPEVIRTVGGCWVKLRLV